MQNDMKLDSNFFLQYKDKFELKKIRVLKKTREWEIGRASCRERVSNCV